MKSKRAMIERRNTERRLRRELKKKPPGLLSKWFDTILKWAQRLFLVSFLVIAIAPFISLVPGLEDTDLLLFTAERMFTLLLFGILLIASLVGMRILLKPTSDSNRTQQKLDSRQRKIIKSALLLFFAIVLIISSIVCWGQLKGLMSLWMSLLDLVQFNATLYLDLLFVY